MLFNTPRIRSGISEEQSVKSRAGRFDMQFDGCGSGFFVAAPDAVKDAAVLQLGFFHMFGVHNLIGVHEQLATGGGDSFDMSRAPRGYSDAVVEGVVRATIARSILSESHVVHGTLQNREILLGATLCCEFRGSPFNGNTKLDNVFEFGEVTAHASKPPLVGLLKGSDEGTSLLAASGDKVSLFGENSDGFSQRDAAHAESRRKVSFRRQPLARSQISSVNGNSHFISEALHRRDRARSTDRQHASKHRSCLTAHKGS